MARPSRRKASTTILVMSLAYGVCMMLKSVVSVSNMQKPLWCLVVNTTYFHSGHFCGTGPCGGIEMHWIEAFGQLVDITVQVIRRSTHHAVRDHHPQLGVKAPVYKHAEAQVAEHHASRPGWFRFRICSWPVAEREQTRSKVL
jgi:hypothetical protein